MAEIPNVLRSLLDSLPSTQRSEMSKIVVNRVKAKARNIVKGMLGADPKKEDAADVEVTPAASSPLEGGLVTTNPPHRNFGDD